LRLTSSPKPTISTPPSSWLPASPPPGSVGRSRSDPPKRIG